MSTSEPVWERVDFDTEGLRDRVARPVVDELVDDMGYPAELPAGAAEVVIVDDTPDVTADLAVHPVGQPDKIAIVHYNDLEVEAERAP